MSTFQRTPKTAEDYKGDKVNSLLSLGIHHDWEFPCYGGKTNHCQLYLKSRNDTEHGQLDDIGKLKKELLHSPTVIGRKMRGKYSNNRMTSIMLWDNAPESENDNWYCKLLFQPGAGPNTLVKVVNPSISATRFPDLFLYLESLLIEWERLFYHQGYINRFLQ